MKRISSAATGIWLCPGSAIADHEPWARSPGPSRIDSRRAVTSAPIANRTARATASDPFASSIAAAWLWKMRWCFSGTPSRRSTVGITPVVPTAAGPRAHIARRTSALPTG
jgi:hypothetical protein